jgi:predicted RNA-binding protein YlqC (UPF0109 family)
MEKPRRNNLGFFMSEEQYLKNLIEPLINDEMRLDKIVDDRGILFMIYLKSKDLSTIVGKEGKNITAIRTLMHIYGSKIEKHISLKANYDENRGQGTTENKR